MNEGIPNLSDFLCDVTLPDNLFKRSYDNYGFFDVDAVANNHFLRVIQRVIQSELGFCGRVFVFSAVEREHLATFSFDESWADNLTQFGSLKQAGDYWGSFLLVASDGSWIVHQTQPVGYGIFAYNGRRGVAEFDEEVKDYFFDCHDLFRWNFGGTRRDRAMRKSFNADFLLGLWMNYCQQRS